MNALTRKTMLRGLALGLSLGLLGGTALADEAGQREDLDACASCHGADGAGSGPVSEYMSIVVPPRVGRAEANGGVFPRRERIAMIDEGTDVGGHGSGIPVWGAVLADPMAAKVQGTSADYVTRGRILSLALYLESIQK